MAVVLEDDVASLHDRAPRGRTDAVVDVDERDVIEPARGIILRRDRDRMKRLRPIVLAAPLERRAARRARQTRRRVESRDAEFRE